MNHVDQVGGKNASLGEMYRQLNQSGVLVPNGFATTADAFREFLDQNHLADKINQSLQQLDVDDVTALAQMGKTIRQWVVDTPFPSALELAITTAYEKLAASSVAVRSSATAEDLPEASFAGQQETFLNISGAQAVLNAVKEVFASLYNDRAIAYRVHHQFDHADVALSAGIQQMVRSDIACSGVMFTLDTESGFEDTVFITAAYGLGETVVQGAVNPDEFYVYKPNLNKNKPAILRRTLGSKAIKMVYTHEQQHQNSTLTVEVPQPQQQCFCLDDTQVQQLAQHALTIENHYGCPMDIEWALDGEDQCLYIVQARPETVKSRDSGSYIERYELQQTPPSPLISGRAIGQRIGNGPAKVITDLSRMSEVKAGDVLVTDMTDPDWEPIMKRASAIVTNRGGRTCHAAIIARELGIPAVVGCGTATEVLAKEKELTVNCAEGDTGNIYSGCLDFKVNKISSGTMPNLPLKIMMNVGNPERAFHFAAIPHAGVGLARVEFIINNMIGIHPKALLEFDTQSDELKQQILEKTQAYADPVSFFVEKLCEGIATLAAAFSPEPVIIRLSDFKSNEYANLLGGENYEPKEENPMIGFRGASRYVSETFKDCFELECKALKKVREQMGFENVQIMVPFTRTVEEAKAVVQRLSHMGLKRGEHGLKLIMMCEIPSNALLANDFLQHFDGFSIGSNDLTQLTLGLDRDSGLVADLFDERDPAVKILLKLAIKACREKNKYIGICGQGPSDHPDLAQWLLQQGISSISLNPDTVVQTWLYLAEHLKS